jgi:hypothetical protein
LADDVRRYGRGVHHKDNEDKVRIGYLCPKVVLAVGTATTAIAPNLGSNRYLRAYGSGG